MAAPLAATDHIRVVLDTSISMRTSDPGRLALLSTVLLYDLANPNLTLGDSFEVLPFHLDWRWATPSDPPPRVPLARIRPHPNGRSAFVQKVRALPYDAKWTYFFPGLQQAIADLQATPATAHDVRAIVLVTDGLPERHMLDHERQLIRDRLQPLLEQNDLRLYVLAFGPEAYAERSFFEAMVATPSGRNLGEVFVDPDGRNLLRNMTILFGRSFGFDAGPAQSLPVAQVDLEGGTTPDRVAVVVFSDQGQRVPTLQLTPPVGEGLNAPVAAQGARVGSASYSFRWVLSPPAGLFGLDTDALRGSVAVLRPIRLSLEIMPAPPRRQTERAMARTLFPMRVLVKPPTGALGDTAIVDLSFRANGPRITDPETGTLGFAWSGDASAPADPRGRPVPEGRVYEILVEFPNDPEPGEEFYVGYLEVEARRGEAVVGSLVGPHAHRIEVHQLLKIAPSPSLGDAIGDSGGSQRVLAARQTGCSTFTLTLEAGDLPHPERPRYDLQAVLDGAVRLEGPFKEAAFLLDGRPLELQGHGTNPGVWKFGRELSRLELLGQHEVCIQVGRPVAGNLGQPASLPVHLTLAESPYDDFRVISPYQLKVEIAGPGLLSRWGSLVLTSLLALLLLAVLWYLRDRPDVPEDLQFSMAVAESPEMLQPGQLGARSLAAKLLGLVATRAIVPRDDIRPLARLVPVDRELYRLRPARGVRVDALDSESVERDRQGVTLRVRTLYRVTRADRSYLFRVEYR